MISNKGIVRTALFFICDGEYVFAGYPYIDEIFLFNLKESKTEEGTTYYYTDEQSIKNVGKMEKLVSKETNEDFYLCSYGYKVYKV